MKNKTNQFIPNGSFYYNVADKCLYLGQVDESGALELNPVNPKKVGDLTFNLVEKFHRVNPQIQGSPYYRVQDFATKETSGFIADLLDSMDIHRLVINPAEPVVFSYLGEFENPTSIDQQVLVRVNQGELGFNFTVGELAQAYMLHGFIVFREQVLASLRYAGII